MNLVVPLKPLVQFNINMQDIRYNIVEAVVWMCSVFFIVCVKQSCMNTRAHSTADEYVVFYKHFWNTQGGFDYWFTIVEQHCSLQDISNNAMQLRIKCN